MFKYYMVLLLTFLLKIFAALPRLKTLAGIRDQHVPVAHVRHVLAGPHECEPKLVLFLCVKESLDAYSYFTRVRYHTGASWPGLRLTCKIQRTWV